MKYSLGLMAALGLVHVVSLSFLSIIRQKLPWYREESVTPGYPLVTLHNEILDFCDLITPTTEEQEKTAIALQYVKDVVFQTCGPKVRVEVFGSQLTGLLQPNSDIDAVCLGAKWDALTTLGQVMSRRSNRGEVHNVTVIHKAKVPLVKFVHTATGKQVDISFNQDSGLLTGSAAKEMMAQMITVRPLVLVLKYFMRQRRLHETFQGGIGSFLLQLMVISVVQKCGRTYTGHGIHGPTNLGFVLLEFLDLFGNKLNYCAAGITLLGQDGGGFYNKRDMGWVKHERPALLSFQNPHDSGIDVGSNSFKVGDCRRAFQAVHERLIVAMFCSTQTSHQWTGSLLSHVIFPDEGLASRTLPKINSNLVWKNEGEHQMEDVQEVYGESSSSYKRKASGESHKSKRKQGRRSYDGASSRRRRPNPAESY
ncbi:unnamed protein product [Choristocarpus tenellus]